MNDFLKRSLAPVGDEAWRMIDSEAVRILKGNLSGRTIVDFNGPHGLAASAVNLGRVKPVAAQTVKGVSWGIRQVLPLAEVSVPFSLSAQDLGQVPRGGAAPDLSAVVSAAQKAALFEERMIYLGIPEGGFEGALAVSTHKPIALPKGTAEFLSAVEDAVLALQQSGIAGPYHLVLGCKPYQALATGDGHGYPLVKRVSRLLEGGSIRWSPAVDGGALLSGRGGDFELTVGQDYAIGYAGTDGDRIDLYLIASFAFRVLEPAAAVALRTKA